MLVGGEMTIPVTAPAPAGISFGRVKNLRRLEPRAVMSRHALAMRRDAIFRRSLALADMAGAGLALALTHAVAAGGTFPLGVYLVMPAAVMLAKVFGLYDREELVIGKTSLAETPMLFQLSTLCTLLILVLNESGSGPPLAASAILALWASMLVGTLVGRNLARRIGRALTPPERCLILGDPLQADRVAHKFECHGSAHAEIVASLPFENFELKRPRKGNFGDYVAERGIDRVIIGSCDDRHRVLDTVRYFKDFDLKVSVLPDLLEVVGSGVEFDEIHGTTLLGVRHFGLSRSSRMLKRGLDVVASTTLLVLLAPVLATIAAAIRLESPGSPLFRQTRVGRDGTRFTMFKFRTMFEGADRLRDDLQALNQSDGVFKIPDDPRITRVGGFLRRTSLDELPQLLNVLLGEMSLVGPRPLITEEDAKIGGWHRRRLHLTPGMTGAWQIMGDTRVPLPEMVSMDYLYIVNWSLWADIRILLQTIGHVAGRRGL
jgi:exopolysaccharide biosynthesis polyprenyl glycosylphosphotransferase